MTYHTDIPAACRLVAETFYGPRGLWLCDAFEAVNTAWFDRELPHPHIMLALTPHGKCLGWSLSPVERPPTIAVHPSVFGGSEKDDPWKVPPDWLGLRFAFDVLVHECMHVSVQYRLGGAEGPTSHNNPQWMSEVNRLAPILGFDNVDAGMSRTKRLPVAGPLTKRGKQPTKVQRVTDGNISFDSVAMFPYGLRMERDEAEGYYRDGELPLELPTP